MRRFLLRVAPVLVAVAVIAPFSAGSPAGAAQGAVAAPTDARATVTSPTSVQVEWSIPADSDADGFIIFAAVGASVIGSQVTCGTCTSVTFGHLAPGTLHQFGIVAYEGSTWSAGVVASATPVEPLCAGVGTACLAVDATDTRGALARNASGLLHGLGAGVDVTRIDDLAPRFWRLRPNDAPNATAIAAGAEVTYLLSDLWRAGTYSEARGGQMNPWDNWELYSWWVETLVRWHAATLQSPAHWEIQNEPDQPGIYNETTSPPTRANILEQFRVAHDAIRRADPDASIIGPSISRFVLNDPTQPIDLLSFLDMVEQNGLRFDAIVWHEINDQPQHGGPRLVPHNVATMRNLLADRPALGSPEIIINEFGAPWGYQLPGWMVGYFAALEETGVSEANRTCWLDRVNGVTADGCNDAPGTLDGLLAPDGSSTMDVYHVHAAYARMSGDRLRASSSARDVSVLASRPGDGSLSLLAGRHASCLPSNNHLCIDFGLHHSVPVPAAMPATVVVETGAAGCTWQVTTIRVRNASSPLAAPVTSTSTARTGADGVLRISIPAFADGEAYSIVLDPSRKSNGPRRPGCA